VGSTPTSSAIAWNRSRRISYSHQILAGGSVQVGSIVSSDRHVPELAREWAGRSPGQRWQSLDGTLCFADISGFTALAERLSERGRAGGEELIETLGQIFTRMLDVACAHGGTLLKFGGDALLLFFRGDDHALQAASAAVRMRQVVRDASGTPTSVGPMRLSISMGLHSGVCDFFLVGSPHRELLLLGPAASEILAAESSARAGEIAVTAATAARLPRNAVVERQGRPLLRWRKPRAGGPTADPAPASGTPAAVPLLPPVLDTHLGAGSPDPEHRVACIAFLRLSGTDRLLERDGGEVLGETLHRALTDIFAALTEHGITLLATDIDRDGFKLFLAAGVPHALEDDEGAMLLALRRVFDAHLPIPVQAGVNHGHVFTAEIGGPRRAAYSAMGDTTNTAARIAAKAPIGHLYAHPSVLDNSLTVFAATPAPPLLLKGKRAPLTVYDVGETRGRRGREGFYDLPFVGRAADLAELARPIEQWLQGQTVSVSVSGPPGIGKTRLITEALDHRGLEPMLWLRCEPYASGQPYRVLNLPLRHLLGLPVDPRDASAALPGVIARLAPAAAPWLPLIAEACGLTSAMTPEVADLEARFRRDRLATVLSDLLGALELPHGLIWIDDAQWCDEATLDLVSRLVAADTTTPWLLLSSGRACERPFTSGELLALAPMSDDDLRALVRAATEAAPLRSEDMDSVVRSAGGNPLFALEITRMARGSEPGAEIPESLEAALAARTDALDPQRRRVLRCAAVLGRSFPTWLLLAVLEQLGHPVEASVFGRMQGLLDPDGDDRLRFTDALVRDVTYAGTAFRFRRRVHRLAAEQWMAQDDPDRAAAQLAVHFGEAGDAERCWRFARLAGDRAAESYANVEAARLYGTALQAARRLPTVDVQDQRNLWTRLGDVYELAGRFEQAMEAYRQALALAREDARLRADLLIRRARAKERQGALKAAYRDLSRGLRLLEVAPPGHAAQRARLLTAAAMVRLGQDRHQDAITLARTAEAEARVTVEQTALGRALIVQELASLALEGPGDGRFLTEALQIFEALGHLPMQADVHANQGFRCAHAGQWREAVAWLRSARDLYLRTGNTTGAAFPGLNMGEMLVKQRRYTEAEPPLQEALLTFRAVGSAEGVATARAQLARIRLARGDLTEAQSLLEEVLGVLVQNGQPLVALEVHALLAETRLRQGAAAQALEELDRAIHGAGRDAEIVRASYAGPRARALAELGRLDEARAELDAGLSAARERHQPYEEAMLLLTRTELADRLNIPAKPAETARMRSILAQLDVAAVPV
jgi:class 3 adenylate cyclase/tetratricopeptide (TPR) repeat protein